MERFLYRTEIMIPARGTFETPDFAAFYGLGLLPYASGLDSGGIGRFAKSRQRY
jgi:hypothetical protein